MESMTDAGQLLRDYGWAAEKKLRANRDGVCEVSYPMNITDLQLTTRVDGFADTCSMEHSGPLLAEFRRRRIPAFL